MELYVCRSQTDVTWAREECCRMKLAIGIRVILLEDEIESHGGICGDLSRGVDGWSEQGISTGVEARIHNDMSFPLF